MTPSLFLGGGKRFFISLLVWLLPGSTVHHLHGDLFSYPHCCFQQRVHPCRGADENRTPDLSNAYLSAALHLSFSYAKPLLDTDHWPVNTLTLYVVPTVIRKSEELQENTSGSAADKRGVAPADCWNWGELGFKEYKLKGSFISWFVGLCLSCSIWPSSISSPYTFSIHLSPSPS